MAIAPSRTAQPSRASRTTGRPRDLEHALLLVAFGSDDVAATAWAEVSTSLDIDGLPFELHGLFPQIAAKLRRLDVQTPALPRFDGVRRRLWSLNSLRLRALAEALTALETANIAATVTGGMAVLLYRDDLALRPLSEVDVVVDATLGQQAARVLESHGWGVRRRRRDGFWMDQHATLLERGGQTVTLRWSHTASLVSASIRRSAAAAGMAVDLATPTDVLAFTLIDGRTLPGYFPVRRQADALLLGALDEPAVDWSAFVEHVRAKHAQPEVAAELARLDGLDGAAPPWVAPALSTTSIPLRERLAYGKQRFPAVSASLRRSRDANLVAAVAALPRELAEIWDLPGAGSVAKAAAERVAQRLTRRATARKQRP